MNAITRMLDAALGIRPGASETTNTGTIENAMRSAPVKVAVLPGPDPASLTVGSHAPREPLSPEAEAELRVTHRNTKPVEDPLASVPHPIEEQRLVFLAFAIKSGFKLPAKALADLETLDTPWLNLVKAIPEYSDAKAKEAFHASKVDIAKRISRGDSSAKTADQWTMDDWVSDFQIRRKAIKTEQRNVEHQAQAVAMPVLASYADFLNQLIDKLEIPLREQAESFACKYYPPNWVLLMKKEAELCSQGRRRIAGRPSNMLSVLQIS